MDWNLELRKDGETLDGVVKMCIGRMMIRQVGYRGRELLTFQKT